MLILKSREDGSDLGALLAQLWDVLNTPIEKRQKTLDDDLAIFPYVNGGLFAEPLPVCSFNTKLRECLLECSRFYWARISPAIFGSIFQGVMDDKERRQIGAHYTSERDIMKLIKGLFLDELQAELKTRLGDRSTSRNARLKEFQDKLRSLRFFDPACGCGNFLILAYREIRRMEQEVLVALHTIKGKKSFDMQRMLDVRDLSKVDVDQFYGIEIGEWPVRIAEVGLWLADHQCNLELGEALGQTFRRLPLQASPTLKIANALRTDWREVLPPTDNVYVLGNPPFVGKHLMTAGQKADMDLVCGRVKGSGVLDYVTGWYFKASEFIQNTSIECAFVSTNSITQGEQVGVLWNHLFSSYGIKIHFAHRTFAWASEARGKAHVHVVIIGFGLLDRTAKEIFEYDRPGGDAVVAPAKNINPYLVEGSDLCILKRRKPLCQSDKMVYGSKPVDGGHLLLSSSEKTELLSICPDAKLFLRRFHGSVEFLSSIDRWCLWLAEVSPEQWRNLTPIRDRVEAVRRFRLASKKKKTVEQAAQPHIFGELRQPMNSYLVVPEVSSENRRYIPVGFVGSKVIASNLLYTVPNASRYTLGIITSQMHMAWMRTVAGRLKSDYRYSAGLVYNNFPWPEDVSDKNRNAVEADAQAVLDARANYPKSSLADLYDPLSMPAPLVKAHAKLDRAVDRCYRGQKFQSDRERVEHLFALYEKLTAPLVAEKKTKKRGGKRNE